MDKKAFVWIAVACAWLAVGWAIASGNADAETFSYCMFATVIVAFFNKPT